jgi:GT2 family glycosyltransferase
MNKLPHVAIAILNYNGYGLLQAYLPSIVAIDYPNKSIWVIDNSSTDGSLEFLENQYPEIGLIQNRGNYGFAKGYNLGLEKIEADYFLLINSDVEVKPGFLTPLVEAMEKDPKIAISQPKIRWLRKPEYFEYAGAAGGLLDGWGYPLCRGRLFEKLEIDRGQFNQDAFVFWASGACLLVKSEIFNALGGFYNYFFMHQEEIDLCWRAQNAGFKILACGKSSVMHLGAASLQKENPLKTFYNFRNNLVMLCRNMPIGRLFWVLPLRWVLDGVAAVSFLFQGNHGAGLAVIRGWTAFGLWLLRKKPNKWPGKRGFGRLQGISNTPALWKRFFEKS